MFCDASLLGFEPRRERFQDAYGFHNPSQWLILMYQRNYHQSAWVLHNIRGWILIERN